MGAVISFSCHCDCGTSDFVILYPDRAAGTGISRRASGCLSGDMVGWRAFQGCRSLTAWQKESF